MRHGCILGLNEGFIRIARTSSRIKKKRPFRRLGKRPIGGRVASKRDIIKHILS